MDGSHQGVFQTGERVAIVGAGIPVGVGPAKDAPEAPVADLAEGEVK